MELEREFNLWGVSEFAVTPPSQKTVSVRYILREKEIVLTSNLHC